MSSYIPRFSFEGSGPGGIGPLRGQGGEWDSASTSSENEKGCRRDNPMLGITRRKIVTGYSRVVIIVATMSEETYLVLR